MPDPNLGYNVQGGTRGTNGVVVPGATPASASSRSGGNRFFDNPNGTSTASFGTGGSPASFQSPATGQANIWGNTNDWNQNVNGGAAGVNFSSPGNPNVNYLGQTAAQNLANQYGAGLATQNLQGMASPGFGAPSAPMYGLDFGYGDPISAGQVQLWQNRGDSQAEINKRIQAGLNNTGWGGPAPSTNQATFWDGLNTTGNESTRFPNTGSFGSDVFQANVAGRGNYGDSVQARDARAAAKAQAEAAAQAAQSQNNPQAQQKAQDDLLAYLARILFGGQSTSDPSNNLTPYDTAESVAANPANQAPARLAPRVRMPGLGANNGNLNTTYYWPQSEPKY